MNTYELKTVEETIIVQDGMSTTTYQVPVDTNGDPVSYLSSFRVIRDGEMIVFDSEQEYIDWLSQNT